MATKKRKTKKKTEPTNIVHELAKRLSELEDDTCFLCGKDVKGKSRAHIENMTKTLCLPCFEARSFGKKKAKG